MQLCEAKKIQKQQVGPFEEYRVCLMRVQQRVNSFVLDCRETQCAYASACGAPACGAL